MREIAIRPKYPEDEKGNTKRCADQEVLKSNRLELQKIMLVKITGRLNVRVIKHSIQYGTAFLSKLLPA